MKYDAIFTSDIIAKTNKAADKAFLLKNSSEYHDIKLDILKIIIDAIVKTMTDSFNQTIKKEDNCNFTYNERLKTDRDMMTDIYVALTENENLFLNKIIDDYDPKKSAEMGFYGYFASSLSKKIKEKNSKIDGTNEEKRIISRIIKYAELYGIPANKMTENDLTEIANQMGFNYQKIYDAWKFNCEMNAGQLDENIAYEPSYADKASDNIPHHDPRYYLDDFKHIDAFCISEFQTNENPRKYFHLFMTKNYSENICIYEVKKTLSSAVYKQVNSERQQNDSKPKSISTKDILKNHWDMIQIEDDRNVLCIKNKFYCISKDVFDYIIENHALYDNNCMAKALGCTPENVSGKYKPKYNKICEKINCEIKEYLM